MTTQNKLDYIDILNGYIHPDILRDHFPNTNKLEFNNPIITKDNIKVINKEASKLTKNNLQKLYKTIDVSEAIYYEDMTFIKDDMILKKIPIKLRKLFNQ